MPDAIQVAVAKAAVVHLKAGTYSRNITPERSYADWEIEMEEAEQLRVDVVAVSTEVKVELATRTKLKYTIPIDIAVRKKFSTEKQNPETGRLELAEIDALVLLTQEIHEQFAPQRLTGFTSAVWQETKILASPMKDHLRQHRQFTAVVRVTFRAENTVA